MALQQKTVRASSEILLDLKVNELLKDGWELKSDVKCVIKQSNYTSGSENTEIWYQVLTKYIN